MQVSRGIGWSNESNLLYQILKQLNKLTSIMFGLKPKYKVYSALVYQSGADGPNTIGGGELTVGVTYYISDVTEGADFTNVGAPNNNVGTFFVATGTTPNSWGTGGSTLSYNTGAPYVTILENTIGNIYYTYKNVGDYKIISYDLFPIGKTFIQYGVNGKTQGAASQLFQMGVSLERFELNPNEIVFKVGEILTGNLLDDVFQTGYPLSLEIRVYN